MLVPEEKRGASTHIVRLLDAMYNVATARVRTDCG